jgi:hypothetical protein
MRTHAIRALVVAGAKFTAGPDTEPDDRSRRVRGLPVAASSASDNSKPTGPPTDR